MRKRNSQRVVVLSSPNKLGDAVVCMPMAGWLKRCWPDVQVIALTTAYSEALWRYCEHIDEVVTTDAIGAEGPAAAVASLARRRPDILVHVKADPRVARWARAARIPLRVGTARIWWHWATCNRFTSFSPNGSGLHQSQINIRLMRPLGLPQPDSAEALIPYFGLRPPAPSPRVARLLAGDGRTVVLHPVATTSPSWGSANFNALIDQLATRGDRCLITGTAEEAASCRGELRLDPPGVVDLRGRLSLDELVELVAGADALVAASTGPLHLAAALGVRTVGLFSMGRATSPRRWRPIGARAKALVLDPECRGCAKGGPCACIGAISAANVARALDDLGP